MDKSLVIYCKKQDYNIKRISVYLQYMWLSGVDYINNYYFCFGE